MDPWGGTWVYNRLPFGLCSGPASWQKLLDHILVGVPNTFVYLDDVLIFGASKAEHDHTLQMVFEKLAKNNMALSLDKCIFGKPEVLRLCRKQTRNPPTSQKVRRVKKFQAPTVTEGHSTFLRRIKLL